MGATNKTPNIELPQFIGTDKPSWLGDFNGAMNAIDTFAGKTTGDIGTVTATANAAKAAAEAASASVTALETTVNQHTTEISDTMADVSALEADVQQINTKINSLPTLSLTKLEAYAHLSNWSIWNMAWSIENLPGSPVFFVPISARTPVTNQNVLLWRIKGNPLNLNGQSLVTGNNQNITLTVVARAYNSLNKLSSIRACYNINDNYTYLTLEDQVTSTNGVYYFNSCSLINTETSSLYNVYLP